MFTGVHPGVQLDETATAEAFYDARTASIKSMSSAAICRHTAVAKQVLTAVRL